LASHHDDIWWSVGILSFTRQMLSGQLHTTSLRKRVPGTQYDRLGGPQFQPEYGSDNKLGIKSCLSRWLPDTIL